jgi:hypothetical protein
MMPSDVSVGGEARSEVPSLGRFALAAGSGLALLFSVGMIVGVSAASLEHQKLKPAGLAAALAALLAAIVAGIVLRRVLPSLLPTPASPRVGRARRMVILSGAVGGVLGLVLALGSLGGLGGGPEPQDMASALSSSPVPRWVALAAIAVWLGVVPWLTIVWHRSIDEHEAGAYRDGALAGIYAYFAIAPTWWMAWRGGLVPEPQHMVVFLVVVTIVGLVWAWRRYR